jgi:septal ring factor EnvC (AmiA/AmiB activator)
MKLSEIVASVNELKKTVADFIGDKAKATTEALNTFSAKLNSLEIGTVAELTQKTADLATAQQTIATLQKNLETAQTEVNSLGGALQTACAELKLELKENAGSAEMITALKDGVATTLAKLSVPPQNIPAAKPSAQNAGGSDKPKTFTERCLEANGKSNRN